MIVVSNTTELERLYNLNILRDDEQVIVQGGLKGKQKYNAEKYTLRTTYTVRQIKQIIAQMKLIEGSIPKEWNEYQRAKYIYEVLGKRIEYNHNREEQRTQQASNLTILLSGKGVCAGYSLLYKEMMDRQGIECDYMRGIVESRTGKKGLHAWNVLTIKGQTFPVDLTWDAVRLQRGEKQLEFFGVDEKFLEVHKTEPDERQYNYVVHSKESINSIRTDPNERNRYIDESRNHVDKEQIGDIIQLAIEETYQKFKGRVGSENAKRQVIAAIKKYIKDGDAMGFTRNGNARDQLEQYVLPREMMLAIARNYMEIESKKPEKAILWNAANETAKKYSRYYAEQAIGKYIYTGKAEGFTRNNNARESLVRNFTPESSLNLIVNTVVESELERIMMSDAKYQNTINQAQTHYFSGDEFAKVQLPMEERKGIITKAIQWIKEKMREQQNTKNSQKKEQELKTKNDENQR